MIKREGHVGLAVCGVIAGITLVCFLIWCVGSTNFQTPAGYMGYVTQRSVFGKTKYIKVQTGPTSSSRMWLGGGVNVSITPFTFDEEFKGDTSVLSKDNNKLSFSLHFIFRIRPTEEAIKKFVEKYTTTKDNDKPDEIVKTAYNNFIKEQLRTYGRNAVQRYEALRAKEKIVEISKEVFEEISQWVKKAGDDDIFEILQVAIGNIQLPSEVSDKAAQYVASEIELNRLRDVEMPQQAQKLLIAQKQAAIRVADAQGVADAMDKIKSSLTLEYLQYEAIKAQSALVGSPNHSVIYIPVSNLGIPLVGSVDMKTGTNMEKPDGSYQKWANPKEKK